MRPGVAHKAYSFGFPEIEYAGGIDLPVLTNFGSGL
jgi:hypothetical protein